ncbi:DMT family transporter [Streptosporangium pseudovulgare]|uniref:Multidrug transporter n=1 Tax=Streptosporangium pseudovulgare TaxID=35765 RepID=A0ABQ2R041_9ACTN|nr:DMT family transporter [Streptosporangium pseudovulgare]GGQ03400.1 multidrug transporter [Streptosporangium pseudovulgare]
MSAMVLATACAVVYGTADFFGGLATRRSKVVMAVVVLSQSAGLVTVGVLLPFLPGRPSAEALGWGMAAGLSGTVGLVLFYRALATGTMSVVAPITAVTSAALPVIFGVATGDRPEPVALGGVALALVAVVLVSRESPAAESGPRRTPVLAALVAGAGFGGFFVLLAQTPDDGGLWPLAGARTVSITMIVLLAAVTGRTLRPGRGASRIVITAGVLDMTANVLFLLAQQRGMLSLVAVLVSLYPVSTLLLARQVLGERLNAVQGAGVGVALVAVTLIAASPSP